jgi:hypothetical protein
LDALFTLLEKHGGTALIIASIIPSVNSPTREFFMDGYRLPLELLILSIIQLMAPMPVLWSLWLVSLRAFCNLMGFAQPPYVDAVVAMIHPLHRQFAPAISHGGGVFSYSAALKGRRDT